MARSCETSGWWLCGQKGAGEAAAREKKIRKTREEDEFGCGEGGLAGGSQEKKIRKTKEDRRERR